MAIQKFNEPEGIEDKHLEFLDDLRGSGSTNMYGAGPFLTAKFPELTEKAALAYVVYWMETYGIRQDIKEASNVRKKERNDG
mgnify:CR=1 FL=1